ncbi:CBS domain-containing protein, partial [Faecalibaculum rodentium]|uniref:CBS domain-containing protein n=1 Tax=Faecalibaculum rodentium TaxID=1702221 RepID=UPI0025A26F76
DFLYYLTDHPDTDLDNVFIRQILRPDFIQAVPFNVSMGQLLATSLEQNFVPVVDDRNIFIGIVTRKNILAYLMHDKDVKDRIIELSMRIANLGGFYSDRLSGTGESIHGSGC